MPLLVIFLLALVLRFLYFPENTYFAYDAARDAYGGLDILKRDFKIVGPPTSISPDLFHGAAYYYLIAPVLLIFDKNPEAVSAFLRIINGLGVFLVFLAGSFLFNKKVAFLASFLYAVSYEQSQQSLTFGHPAPATFTVLLFYLGLIILIFKKLSWGLILSLAGAGLSIQFEGVFGLLMVILILSALIFRSSFKLSLKTYALSFFVFCLTVSTYILAELKFDFRSAKTVLSIIGSQGGSNFDPSHLAYVTVRLIHDNLAANWNLAILLSLILLASLIYLIKQKELKKQTLFLVLWFLGGLLPNILSDRFSYYYSAGSTASILILVSFLIWKFLNQKIILAILILITLGNLSLILGNDKGPNKDIIIQPGMLIGSQKKALDYIYKEAGNESFAVSAITVPLNVNTTWSYLFEAFGKRYAYLPVWGGEVAAGFPGNLKVETKRSNLPDIRFLIIEPTVGIETYIVDAILRQENYFSKVEDEKTFGTIKVQKRIRI